MNLSVWFKKSKEFEWLSQIEKRQNNLDEQVDSKFDIGVLNPDYVVLTYRRDIKKSLHCKSRVFTEKKKGKYQIE